MPRKITFRAEKEYSRIDHFLRECLPEWSRTRVQQLILDRHIRMNDQPVVRKSTEVHPGDTIEVELIEASRPKPLFLQPDYRPSQVLEKLFEDRFLLVIDKPAGIPVHPGAGEPRETIMDIFLFDHPAAEEYENGQRPGIVHRLDRDTSGILILAKDKNTRVRMQKKFKKREIKKKYLALVAGKMRFKNGVIDAPISRSRRDRKKFTASAVQREGEHRTREALTAFSVLLEWETGSLIRLIPETGRTHQIRVHLSHVGHPVLGDRVYGQGHPFPRLALHAAEIAFTHPVTGHLITIHSPLPAEIRRYIRNMLEHR